jgi:hypothetical protein
MKNTNRKVDYNLLFKIQEFGLGKAVLVASEDNLKVSFYYWNKKFNPKPESPEVEYGSTRIGLFWLLLHQL